MSSINIRGADYTIRKIFSDDFVFTIPLYQRPYSWTIEEAGELLEDLIAYMGDGKESLDDLMPYFLGSIVLIKGDKPDAQVVDGQQRLTTLAILLAALRILMYPVFGKDLTPFLVEKGNAIANVPNRYRLTLRDRDANFFQEYVQDEGGIEKLKELNATLPSESQTNIRENALLFLQRLEELSEDQRLHLWLNLLSNGDWIPVAMLYLRQNWHNPDALLRFFTNLERLAANFMVLRVPRYRRVNRYNALLVAIDRKEDLYTQHSPLQLTYDERRTTYNTLNGNIYQAFGLNRVCQYVLLRLDAMLSEGTASYEYSTITIEHVLPQHPTSDSDWMKRFPTKEIREKYVHRLGNLVLLSRSKNKDASNYDFIQKKQKYFASYRGISPFVLTSQVLQQSDWTPAIIEQRQSMLMNRLCLEWGLLSSR